MNLNPHNILPFINRFQIRAQDAAWLLKTWTHTDPTGKDILYVKHVTLGSIIGLVQLFVESAFGTKTIHSSGWCKQCRVCISANREMRLAAYSHLLCQFEQSHFLYISNRVCPPVTLHKKGASIRPLLWGTNGITAASYLLCLRLLWQFFIAFTQRDQHTWVIGPVKRIIHSQTKDHFMNHC